MAVSGSGRPLRSLWREPEPEVVAAAAAALEFRDVFKIFRSGPAETVALRGVELRIAPREFVAVLGPSGCGKSTMLSLAAALDEPSAGEVRVDGRPLQRMTEAELVSYRARTVALVFQSDNLWPSLSARENIILGLRLAGRQRAGEQADEALALFGLQQRGHHRGAELSGGEQQRVAVAAAFARRAPLVLADEPTGELDAGNERRVLDALLELRRHGGSAVIVVTHSDRVAEAADRVIEMRDGRVVT